jgi:hypothetical protein
VQCDDRALRAEGGRAGGPSRRGRPKLRPANKRWLVDMITSGKVDNAAQLARMLKDTAGVEVSVYTVRRTLKGGGLKGVFKENRLRLRL